MKSKARTFISCRIESFIYREPPPPPPPTRHVVRAVMQVPLQDMEDFRAYTTDDKWGVRPKSESESVLRLTRSLEECAKLPFDRRFKRRPSLKAILAGMLERMATGPVENVSILVYREQWDLIEANARFYGISPAEHCLCCLGYHALLGREDEKAKRPPTPIESFDRKLAMESRASRKTVS